MTSTELIEKLAAGLKQKGYSDLKVSTDWSPQILLSSTNYGDVKFLIRHEGLLKIYAVKDMKPVKYNCNGFYYYKGADGHDYEEEYHNIFEYFELNGYSRFKNEYDFLNNIIKVINKRKYNL